MTDIIISDKKEEVKKVEAEDVKNTLRAADEYAKLKEENDRLEAEYNRRLEIQAKMQLGGKSLAGQREKTPEEQAKEEADKLLSIFGR